MARKPRPEWTCDRCHVVQAWTHFRSYSFYDSEWKICNTCVNELVRSWIMAHAVDIRTPGLLKRNEEDHT